MYWLMERLPATRELAGLLGLNRTTISAAYGMLEAEGLISGQVGKGSFVTSGPASAAGVPWNSLLEQSEAPAGLPSAGWGQELPCARLELGCASPSEKLSDPVSLGHGTCRNPDRCNR